MARILLAEDDPDIRDLVAFRLSMNGHTVTPVSDGVEALEAWRSQAFDLLITDITMPRMSGIELIRRVRRTQEGSVPVVVMSALAHHDHRLALKDVDAYMSKPFNLAELSRIVEELITGPGPS